MNSADLWKPVGDIAQPSSAGAIPWTPPVETGFEQEKALAEDPGCFWGSLDAEVGGIKAIRSIESNWRHCSQ